MPFDARVAISSHLPEDQSHFNIVHRTYQTGKGNSPARKYYTAPVALSSPRLMKIVDEKPDTLFVDSSKRATLRVKSKGASIPSTSLHVHLNHLRRELALYSGGHPCVAA